jgi:hypothetical protein
MQKAENLTKNGIQKLQHGKFQSTLIKNKYEKFFAHWFHY